MYAANIIHTPPRKYLYDFPKNTISSLPLFKQMPQQKMLEIARLIQYSLYV